VKFSIPILAFIVALLLVASQAIYTVDQRKYAIKFQLGEVIETQSNAGLYFKVPLVQNVKYYDKVNQVLDNAEPDRITTSEKKPLLVDFFVLWRILDVKQYYVSVGGDEEAARRRLSQTVRANLAEEVNKHTAHETISTERELITSLTRQKGQCRRRVDRRRSHRRPAPPRRIAARCHRSRPIKRMESERRRVANELRSLGSAEREKIQADADRQRQVILADAYRAAQKVKGEGRCACIGDLCRRIWPESRVLLVLSQPRSVQGDVPQQERHADPRSKRRILSILQAIRLGPRVQGAGEVAARTRGRSGGIAVDRVRAVADTRRTAAVSRAARLARGVSAPD
jgi:membrane protease subunit HflC